MRVRRQATSIGLLGLTAAAAVVLAIGAGGSAMAGGIMPTKAPPALPIDPGYDWTGFYVGGHLGYAGGTSNWTAAQLGVAPISGSLDLFKSYDAFKDDGSYFAGLQAGYDYMSPSRFVFGIAADVSFPTFPNADGISIGGMSTFVSPVIGAQQFSETMLDFGTLRARVGYAPGNWLWYATGGFAWAYDQQTLTNVATGASQMPFLWRFGWVVGGGVEAPIAPHWTFNVEYLFADYGDRGIDYATGQHFISDWAMQELRAGVNYRFGSGDATLKSPGSGAAGQDIVSLHGQATFVWQGYPAIRSPYMGANSLPGSGLGRETTDATLYAGLRLWSGGELWINPEIDQGFGFANTHGVAGFPSAEAYKMGADDPYGRLQRLFIRQTIDLGGDSEKVDADVNQFAGTRTTNRLVLTLGRFGIADIFDTNKYANNPKTDFLNWSLANAGTFDYAGDGWGYSYGGVAEWYQGNWTLRGGAFDLSVTPAGGNSPDAGNLDPTFQQFQMVGEIERRYQLFDQPGVLKVTGFLSRGRAGDYADAIALATITGTPADITAVRVYRSRPGISLNLQQQINDTVGVFARAGWSDGNVEPWDFTDIDRTVSTGVSVNGKQWGRPDDTFGLAGVLNGISSEHQAFLNAGGLGILVGDGMLPHPGIEQIVETYYSYALSDSTHLTADYQFINNPAYNTDRGPVNVFSGRVHWQF